MDTSQTLSQRALSIARQRGIARAQDFRAAGIPPVFLTRLCQRGKLQRLSRGLYRLADPEHKEARHSLAEAAWLAPHGVVSLPTALQHHELTTQLPHPAWFTFHHKARTGHTRYWRVVGRRVAPH